MHKRHESRNEKCDTEIPSMRETKSLSVKVRVCVCVITLWGPNVLKRIEVYDILAL